jgi:hypothetical protein
VCLTHQGKIYSKNENLCFLNFAKIYFFTWRKFPKITYIFVENAKKDFLLTILSKILYVSSQKAKINKRGNLSRNVETIAFVSTLLERNKEGHVEEVARQTITMGGL